MTRVLAQPRHQQPIGYSAKEESGKHKFPEERRCIALDDVRIDPASVMVLSRSNVQIIKIDKSVLLDSEGNGAMPRWAEALAVLLKTTNLEVIAEGVETAEQLAMLRAAGVRQVRGHYFSAPLRENAFLHYFRHHG